MDKNIPRVDRTAYNNCAFRWAAENGHIEVVKRLLTCPGVDPTADNNHAIQSAAENGHIEVVKLLLTYPGVDPKASKEVAAMVDLLNNQKSEAVKLRPFFHQCIKPGVGSRHANLMKTNSESPGL